MLFDDLQIKTLIHEEKLYVNVNDLSEHLIKSLNNFVNEYEMVSSMIPMTENEKTFVMGISSGMHNVILMLRQSNDEYGLEQINTIEELLGKLND